MKIISLLNSKGGVGKSTLCINLARYLQMSNCSDGQENRCSNVLIVDADPQGSIRDWQEAGAKEDIAVIGADRKQTLLNLPNFLKGSGYDFVLIDTPGKASEIMGAAVAVSDVCLIPVQPSPYDIWASEDVVSLITSRQTIADGRPEGYYVLNRCIPNTKISKDVSEHLAKCPFGVLGTGIRQRVVYAETVSSGETIFDRDNEGAFDDIVALGIDLRRVLGVSQSLEQRTKEVEV